MNWSRQTRQATTKTLVVTRCFRVCPFTRTGQLQVAVLVWEPPRGRTVATLLKSDLKLFMHDYAGLDRVLASWSFVAPAPSAPSTSRDLCCSCPRVSCFQCGGCDLGVVSTQHPFAEPAFLLHRHGSVAADSPRASCRTNPRTDWRDEHSDAATSDPAARRRSCSDDLTGTKLSTDRGADWEQPCSSGDR